ncbi:MAG: KTSC domain-containing protein [Pedobacter sp.]|nr:KTSC domain-containing protein [Pedobacter sp.]
MKKQIIDGIVYTIDQRIENFSVKSKPSSNVAFFGVSHDAANVQLFVQFKNGSSYIYSGLNEHVLIDLINADSIGKFVSSSIVGKFPSIKHEGALVRISPEDICAIERERHGEANGPGLVVNRSGELEEPQF